MNTEKDNELDDFFRKGLEDPVGYTGYAEEDWGSLEKMLDKNKKRGGAVYWLPVLSAAAALLLMLGGWWLFKPKAENHSSAVARIRPVQKNTRMGIGSIRRTTGDKQISAHPHVYAVNPPVVNPGRNRNNIHFKLSSADGSGRDSSGNDKKNLPDGRPFEALAALSGSPVFEPVTLDEQPVHLMDITGIATNPPIFSPAIKAGISAKKRLSYRPLFALSVLAAPDINGVGSFQQSKVGTNAGLLFSAGISKKLTISTGVLYSVKPYVMGFSNYHTPYQFAVAPTNVTADCRMLDIPLNIAYQVYGKKQSKISIGTGLSSYIMLHESYKFNYANAYYTGPANYTVPNSGGYFFGVLNLNATYERQLNSKVGISLQPYLKLPLTNIGYSQIKLQTTGLAVGLKWNLNSLSKP